MSAPSVGTELPNEIERVAAKHERWKGYMRDMPSMEGAVFLPAMFLMKQAIDSAKRALLDNDAIACIQALEELRGFDSKD